MTRLLLLAVIFILATGGSYLDQAQAAAPTSCGGYRLITSISGAGAAALRRIAIERAKVVARVESNGEVQTACVDLTGDGQPELIIQTYSGGAHCCFDIFVYQLQPAFRRILRYAAGNAGGFEVRTLAGRRLLELGDDSFAYYKDLCYACSPSRMPLAACYGNAKFTDCTRQFPQLVRPFVAIYTTMLRDTMKVTDESRLVFVRGSALGIYAAFALMGRETDGLAAVKRITAEPGVITWLAAQRPDVGKWLTARGGKLKR